LPIGRGEIDNGANDGHRLMRYSPDSEPTRFDQSGESARRARQQSPVAGFELDAIIRYQPGKGEQPGLRSRDQPEREPRFAGAGRSADKNRAGSDQHR
jgi:hypothetical protein